MGRGRKPKERVKAGKISGTGKGVLVPISRGQLEEAGVDPDAPLEVNRYVYDTERAEVRLRFYEAEEDE